ncbi:MAG: NfeD family protein [Oscillospiraceae bacterium]|nr:NfeD family protein [Oscillospiraceae bacterium]
MLVFWLVGVGVFLVIEAISAALCSIWFAVGALVAAAVAALDGPIWLQVVLFAAVSGVCFAVLYPRLKHLVSHHHHPTNVDMLIGQTCPVTQRIDNLTETGAVAIAGKTWSARSADGQVIEPEAIVRIKSIHGVKMIVTPVKQETPTEKASAQI